MKLVKDIKLGKNSFFLILIFLYFFLFPSILKSETNSQIKNNEQFVQIKILDKVSSKNSELEIKTIKFKIPNNNYKYVKIIAKNLGKLPAWHLGYPYDGRSWIFVDEISID